MEIEKVMIPIEKIINNSEECFAHVAKEVKETIDWIKKIFLKQVEQAANIKELLAYEGEVWLRFYSNFKFFYQKILL